MFENKVCLVTGAAQGIGRAIVERFANNGAQCVYALDVNAQTLQSAFSDHENVKPVVINICDREAIQYLVESIRETYGRIDVLVNNAGVTRDALLEKMTEQDWDFVIDVNLKGVFNLTQAVAPIMMANNYGSIVTMSSVVGTDGNIGQSNYAATKGGVIAMTKGWAKEFARKGAQVRANCVAPGFIETPMTADLPTKVLELMKQKTPLGRMGTAEDITDGVEFLASDKSSFITGQVLKVDGGLVL
ncbi:beta-ketoacyl-ACP reductase [Vibrio natriegens]|uniref:Beta-ketoacyl-ACP reductase n=1 Tax=Vibrio natriegens NBRC 15636 = ATCC 14048 = DSM 759 TaxID=1219067 RepID=A0AAN0Y5H1_VIBNA|nr:beta-ketoacyl-ACP reductase [Vibrio natriegens]ALR18224.1 short-chain dehydrogenase [Vibrio natriegens NBRC 15636 = ATCC 14048 = DSM 759]ANQ14171.1 beta-ketoacyl-ACP reductase [Vibrio natriegens NBRC 15636 = ATCC 14048 = DSM 759]EPM40207.1 short-chain dehydrogenase [Vibrio natriegens NBRC 15636 = ATCC 14048 = DSM 759]MDX6028890.1 beta-ketoacyl-ACP reductase [Vibrio natriegens NBRC 15636 = ATCC 14048 = DSM 759]UUI14395.1 beta-ketoacyl-ACP reductase [Vibrio natriegens]